MKQRKYLYEDGNVEIETNSYSNETATLTVFCDIAITNGAIDKVANAITRVPGTNTSSKYTKECICDL